MNHQETVNSKRTLHIRPAFEEYGIVPAKNRAQDKPHEGGRNQTNSRGSNKAASTEDINRTVNQIMSNAGTAYNIAGTELRNNTLLCINVKEVPQNHYRSLIENNSMVSKVLPADGHALKIILKDEGEAYRIYTRIEALRKEWKRYDTRSDDHDSGQRTVSGNEQKEQDTRTSVNNEQTKKRFLTEAEQKALDTAPNDKKRAEQAALIVIRGLGTNNIDEGGRKGNLIRLKLKDNKKRQADLSDLKFGMIQSCERSKDAVKKEILLRTGTAKEAYDLFDALCRQASITTTSMWIWGLIMGVLAGVFAYFLAGIGAAAGAGIAVFFFGTVILSLVHRIAPVYAAMIGIMVMISGAGILISIGVFFGYWIVFWLVELGVRGIIRNI